MEISTKLNFLMDQGHSYLTARHTRNGSIWDCVCLRVQAHIDTPIQKSAHSFIMKFQIAQVFGSYTAISYYVCLEDGA